MLKKIFQLVLFAFVALFLAQPAVALEPGDIVVSVSPAEQDLELAPGESYSGFIEVTNRGRLAFNFTVSAAPFQVNSDNYDPDFSTENSYTNLRNWLTFSQTDYHLEPGETARVAFRIKVPTDVPGGGQYAAILVSTEDSSNSSSTVNVTTQVAATLYAQVAGGELRESGELVRHSLPGFVLGSDFAVSATFKNTGNVDFKAQQTISIRDFFTNKEVVTPSSVASDGSPLGSNIIAVLPETSRTSTLIWDGAPQLGVFRVQQTISFLNEEFHFEQIIIICPIWLAGAVIFLLALMIIWIILRFRKRRKNKVSNIQ